jgi:xeroderma pigmentosum group C-complementing protein
VQEELARKKRDVKGKGRARDSDSEGEDEGEVIKSEKSLMKHVLRRKGSRDTSAQLFTALCRALGIPARLVVSLQSVPWQARVGQPKTSTKKTEKDPKGKGKEKAAQNTEEEGDDMDMEEVDIPGSKSGGSFPGSGQSLNGNSAPVAQEKGKGKAPPVIRLRQSRGRKLGSAPPKVQKKRTYAVL